MEVWIYWLIAIAVFIIIELATQWIAAFCFALGCVAAMLLSFANVSLDIQLITMASVSIILFFILGPAIKNRLHNKTGKDKTSTYSNMDALIGRCVLVTEAIPENGIGRVKADGDNWQARTTTGKSVEVGSNVRIISYDSIILTVEPA